MQKNVFILLKMKNNSAQSVFLVKKWGNLNTLSSTSFRPKYPENGTPSHSLIKNILSNLKNIVLLNMCLQNKKKFRPKTRNGRNSAQKSDLGFSIIKAAFAVSFSLDHHYYILNHTSFIYGIKRRKEITKKTVFRPLVA